MKAKKTIEREETLSRLQQWYDETSNPLYAWEIIHRCFANNDVKHMPDWCIRYLRETSKNLYLLSCGADFRTNEKIGPDRAVELIAEALHFSKRGKRNAFATLLKERALMRLGLDIEYHGVDFARDRVMKKRNIDRPRAERVLSKARRLSKGLSKVRD